MELLSKIIDEIDRFQKYDSSFMENCKKLAQFCYDCLDGWEKQKAMLFSIEISTFTQIKDSRKLSAYEKLLDNLAENGLSNDIDFIRCKARLLAEQNKFGEAAALWAKICEIQKARPASGNLRSWKWWRAKFYELDCWAKRPQTQKNDVLHTIEVFENTFPDIPPLWAEKLTLLKQQCRSQPISSGK
jgi:hypothetical protein